MEFITNQQWRYATKAFDANKKVLAEDITLLKDAIQLSVSSYGLQSYKVLIVENTETRKALRPHSWDQGQITDASHLFVFCHYVDVTPSDIDAYLQRTREARNLDSENSALAEYGDFMKIKIAEKSPMEGFIGTNARLISHFQTYYQHVLNGKLILALWKVLSLSNITKSWSCLNKVFVRP